MALLSVTPAPEDGHDVVAPERSLGLVSVLVVDDEPDIRVLVRFVLTMDGRCLVIGEASDGQEAFTIWNEARPDVVILDLRLPDQSGLEVARSILAADPGQQILLFSAYLDREDEQQALAIGVRACIRGDNVGDLADAAVAAAGWQPGRRRRPEFLIGRDQPEALAFPLQSGAEKWAALDALYRECRGDDAEFRRRALSLSDED
jgi:CheY-like chemotaxis protein